MRYLEEVTPTESRERRWCGFPEAFELIGFDSTREIIVAAQSHLSSRGRRR